MAIVYVIISEDIWNDSNGTMVWGVTADSYKANDFVAKLEKKYDIKFTVISARDLDKEV